MMLIVPRSNPPCSSSSSSGTPEEIGSIANSACTLQALTGEDLYPVKDNRIEWSPLRKAEPRNLVTLTVRPLAEKFR
jgi:hypothetical protein